MTDDAGTISPLRLGAASLPAVIVDTYNAELRTSEGFLGDKRAGVHFLALLDDWRGRPRRLGGTDIGAGIIDLNLKKAVNLSGAR
jgi:hypothetical protein